MIFLLRIKTYLKFISAITLESKQCCFCNKLNIHFKMYETYSLRTRNDNIIAVLRKWCFSLVFRLNTSYFSSSELFLLTATKLDHENHMSAGTSATWVVHGSVDELVVFYAHTIFHIPDHRMLPCTCSRRFWSRQRENGPDLQKYRIDTCTASRILADPTLTS